MVTMDNHVGIAVLLQFTQALRQFAHREQLCALDVRSGIFIGFAAIEEKKSLARIKFGFRGAAIDFEWNGHQRP